MATVRQYLLEKAKEFSERDRNPVVAWDCFGAKAWAQACRALAKEVAGMTHDEAVKHLKQRQKEMTRGRNFKDKAGQKLRGHLPGWYLQIDFAKRMDELIDPIAKDRKGWIEITTCGGLDDGKCSTRPGYRRMLGINLEMDWCGRQKDESDVDWLKRRAEWLGRYHGGVKVVRETCWNARREQFDQVVGTVRDFIKMEHLEERPEDRGIIRRAA